MVIEPKEYYKWENRKIECFGQANQNIEISLKIV